MDELIDLVVEKTGLPKDKASEVVDIVLDFIKEKLPDQIAGSLDKFLGGGSSANLLDGLGNLLGGKK